jgi:acetyltransferase-like isoleucine patch superfamily enzyme
MDIHRFCWIEPTASIDRTWPRGVHISRGVYIGEHAIVLTHDFTRGLYLDTHIGEDCQILARSIILPGIRLGDRSIIMPGSVVTADVPAGVAVQGNPARPLTASSKPHRPVGQDVEPKDEKR